MSSSVQARRLAMNDSLESLYAWVDTIPLSRPKRAFTRDFADGVLVAEIIHHFQPRLIQLHNYSPANSLSYKQYNWETLNQRVFKGLGLSFTPQQLNNAAASQPGAAEEILSVVKAKLESMDVPATSYSDPKRSVVKGCKDLELGHPSDDSIPAVHSKPQAEGQAELVAHLQQTIELLSLKVSKLEQLLQLKDAKIQGLTEQVRSLESKC